jgi:pimeloyl-ACP methyl ester carboxylesterase
MPPVSWAGLKGGVEKGTGFGTLTYPTLIVWGSVDSFTSNRRLKAWAERLSKAAGPGMLRWRDFEGAGHFWREPGVMKSMTGEIGEWIRKVS